MNNDLYREEMTFAERFRLFSRLVFSLVRRLVFSCACRPTALQTRLSLQPMAPQTQRRSVLLLLLLAVLLVLLLLSKTRFSRNQQTTLHQTTRNQQTTLHQTSCCREKPAMKCAASLKFLFLETLGLEHRRGFFLPI